MLEKTLFFEANKMKGKNRMLSCELIILRDQPSIDFIFHQNILLFQTKFRKLHELNIYVNKILINTLGVFIEYKKFCFFSFIVQLVKDRI